VYILKGEKTGTVLSSDVNIRVRAAVLGRAHGRCQMCGRTVAQNHVVLVVDHKIPAIGEVPARRITFGQYASSATLGRRPTLLPRTKT
jgi:hypothetical protein